MSSAVSSPSSASSVHHRRRDAAGLLWRRRRPDGGRDVALLRRAAPARSREPVAECRHVVAEDDGAPEARADHRASRTRRCRACSRRFVPRYCPGCEETRRSPRATSPIRLPWRRLQPAIPDCAGSSRPRSSRWSSRWGSSCSWRARTSRACCSRVRWRGVESSACAWRSEGHAGGSPGSSLLKASLWRWPVRRSGWYSPSGAARSSFSSWARGRVPSRWTSRSTGGCSCSRRPSRACVPSAPAWRP